MASSESSDGYFPAGASVLRRVMGERAVGLLYGQRSLMIGALNPIAYVGTAQRSKAGRSPWKRLTHTAEMFDAVFFGTREEADRALAFTHRLHQRVNGEIGAAVGPWPADTRYDAFDPELMLWVVAPMYDSSRVLYESLVRPLRDGERAQLYAEYLRFGELWGMDTSVAPPTADAFDDWWPRALADERMVLTDQARHVGLNIARRIPLPAAARPGFEVAVFLLVGSLPPVVREKYGMPWSARHGLAHRALTTSVRAGRPFVPKAIRRGPSTEFYRLVAKTERRNLRAGRESFVEVS